MEKINFNSEDIASYRDDQMPAVIIARKHYPNQTARRRRRKWALKFLPKVKGANLTKAQEQKEEAAMDEFLDELERDEEFRRNVTLYKQVDQMTTTTLADPDEARVGLEELLEDLEVPEEAPAEEPYISD